MTDDLQQPLGDAGMDALVASLVRVEAPDGFAARVRVALDARGQAVCGAGLQSSVSWLRPALAVAAMLMLVAIWWWRQPVPVKPEVVREARVVAPEARVASTSAARAATADRPFAPRAPLAPRASLAPRAPRAPYAPVHVLVDHERALEALDDLPGVQQTTIDPAAIDPRTIDVTPATAITPLTIDDSRPDPGGEGDHR